MRFSFSTLGCAVALAGLLTSGPGCSIRKMAINSLADALGWKAIEEA